MDSPDNKEKLKQTCLKMMEAAVNGPPIEFAIIILGDKINKRPFVESFVAVEASQSAKVAFSIFTNAIVSCVNPKKDPETEIIDFSENSKGDA